MSYGMRYPFGQLGSAVLVLSLPSSLYSPSLPLLAGQQEKLKCLWCTVSTAQQQQKHQCAINIVLILNPKHSTIPGTRKKVNSILSDTRNTNHIWGSSFFFWELPNYSAAALPVLVPSPWSGWSLGSLLTWSGLFQGWCVAPVCCIVAIYLKLRNLTHYVWRKKWESLPEATFLAHRRKATYDGFQLQNSFHVMPRISACLPSFPLRLIQRKCRLGLHKPWGSLKGCCIFASAGPPSFPINAKVNLKQHNMSIQPLASRRKSSRAVPAGLAGATFLGAILEYQIQGELRMWILWDGFLFSTGTSFLFLSKLK